MIMREEDFERDSDLKDIGHPNKKAKIDFESTQKKSDEMDTVAGGIQAEEDEYWISQLKQHLKRESLYFDGIENFLPMIPSYKTSIKLVERSEALAAIESCWAARQRGYIGTIAGKTELKLPVCAGIPGVGKSRMLHEYGRVFKDMNIHDSVGVLIVYHNGYSPFEEEKSLTISTCLAWRLLHRFLVEPLRKNGVMFETWMKLLFANAELQKISLPIALRVVHAVLRKGGVLSSEILSLFLGIDEYHTAPCGVELLTTCIMDTCSGLHRFGIHVYPMMAGTEWARIEGTQSSNSICVKIPIPFLSARGGIELAGTIFAQGCDNVTFNNRLSIFSQVPRVAIEFTHLVKETFEKNRKLLVSDVDNSEINMLNKYATIWQLQSDETLLMLISYAITNCIVSEQDCPSIPFCRIVNNEKKVQTDLTWRQLSDRGLLQLTTTTRGMVVDIPLTVLVLASQRTVNFNPSNPTLSYLKHNLRDLVHLIRPNGSRLCGLEPWQKWEYFGAAVHAIKLNAWHFMGYSTVQLTKFLCGMTMDRNLEKIHIKIKPAMVFETSVPLSPHLPANNILEVDNNLNSVDLFDKDQYFICLNDSGGEGANIYFRLDGFYPESENDTFSLFLVDPQKRECKIITTDYLRTLCDSIDVVTPKQLNNQPMLNVKLIFSCFATTDKRSVQLPKNTALYTGDSRATYLGALQYHPSALYLTNVNTATKAVLLSLFNDNKDLVDAIFNTRKLTLFQTLGDLREFIESLGFEVNKDLLKNHLMLPQSDFEEENLEEIMGEVEDEEAKE